MSPLVVPAATVQPLREKYIRATGVTWESQSRIGQWNSASTPVGSGGLYLVAIALPARLTISSITFLSATTAANTPTHWWFGLYDNAYGQLAVTADQLTAAWGASTYKTINIATIASGASSSFTTTYEGLYYAAYCMTATTLNTFPVAVQTGSMGAGAISYSLTGSGSAAPPAFPSTASSLSVRSDVTWVGVG